MMLDADSLRNDVIFNKPRINVAPQPFTTGIDIELSNHCNAQCYYCPRDLVTHTGFMTEDVFKTIIDQASEYPEKWHVGACGHGESILHPKIGEFVAYARSKNLPFGLHTNGSLLTPEKRKTLLNSGLSTLRLSVSALGELHEQMYKLKFDPILKNIKDFIEEARGSCKVGIYIVQTDLNKMLIRDYKTFWEDVGVDHCDVFPVSNRSGSISAKNIIYTDNEYFQQVENIFHDEAFTSLCMISFAGYFIGYDGNHYLCANDWEKKVSLGHISKVSLHQVLMLKAQKLSGCGTSICNTCDFNIKNRIKDCLRQTHNVDAIHQLIEVRRNEENAMRAMLSPGDHKS